jgi:hypothetical protein
MRGAQDVDPVDLLDIGLADTIGDPLAQELRQLLPLLAVDLFGILQPPGDFPRHVHRQADRASHDRAGQRAAADLIDAADYDAVFDPRFDLVLPVRHASPGPPLWRYFFGNSS